MKYVLVLASAILFAACGADNGKDGLNGNSGNSGAVGPQGDRGSNGTNGTNGSNGFNSLLLLSRFTSDTSVCASGSGVLVKSGLDTNRDNILQVIEATNSTVVCDGDQGPQGNTGATGAAGTSAPQYQITQFITPCPSIVTPYREVLLRLANGAIVSSFSDNGSALSTRLSLLPAGAYIDTDGSNCAFSVDNTGVLTDSFGNVFNP